MMHEKNTVAVKILGKIFNVKCPADQVANLHKAAKYFDDKVNEIHAADKIINIDNLIVITALNIVNELLVQKRQNSSCIDSMNHKIDDLQNMITDSLDQD